MTPAQIQCCMARNSVLIIRFSALGDILMTVPLVESLARTYPETDFYVVSRPYVASIFGRLPDNVHFRGLNPRNYSGLLGLLRMWRELQSWARPNYLCDLHDVLRTKVLRTLAWMSGVVVTHTCKDRAARKRFLHQRPVVQMMSVFDRHMASFARLGFPIKPTEPQQANVNVISKHRIGIAPFAAHKGKIYPLHLMKQVVRILAERGWQVYLFGAGPEEKTLMSQWEMIINAAVKRPNVHSMVGVLPDMAAELDFIATLDVMLTMDSGNMHLAALTDVRIISIWGATHPRGGFLPWQRTDKDCIQKSELHCRPCSIFGNKECRFGDYRCLHFSPELIIRRICE